MRRELWEDSEQGGDVNLPVLRIAQAAGRSKCRGQMVVVVGGPKSLGKRGNFCFFFLVLTILGQEITAPHSPTGPSEGSKNACPVEEYWVGYFWAL